MPVIDALQSGHVDAGAMTSQQVPGVGGAAAGGGGVGDGSGSCHAVRATLPVVRSPNHSADCPLGMSTVMTSPCSMDLLSWLIFRRRYTFYGWWRSAVVERRSLAGELPLSRAHPAVDG